MPCKTVFFVSGELMDREFLRRIRPCFGSAVVSRLSSCPSAPMPVWPSLLLASPGAPSSPQWVSSFGQRRAAWSEILQGEHTALGVHANALLPHAGLPRAAIFDQSLRQPAQRPEVRNICQEKPPISFYYSVRQARLRRVGFRSPACPECRHWERP